MFDQRKRVGSKPTFFCYRNCGFPQKSTTIKQKNHSIILLIYKSNDDLLAIGIIIVKSMLLNILIYEDKNIYPKE